MSLAIIREQLTNRLADVVGAASKYPELPEESPTRLPAVVTKWTTRPLRDRYGIVATGARAREHTIEAIVVVSQRRMMPDEDAEGMAMAELIMDDFDDDGRLNETASQCTLANVAPFVLQYGDTNNGVAFYALRCDFVVRETTT